MGCVVTMASIRSGHLFDSAPHGSEGRSDSGRFPVKWKIVISLRGRAHHPTKADSKRAHMQEDDRLRALVGQLTNHPASEIRLDAWPTDYGLDSLSILVFREECERTFGVYIPDDDWAVMR